MRAGAAFVAAFASLLAAPVAGQQDDAAAADRDGPVSVRCSALADMEQGQQITTVFYIAGYYDAQRDAMTIATVGQSAQTAGQAPTSEQAVPANGQQAPPDQQQPSTDQQPAPAEGAAPARAGARAGAVIPELALDAILAACAQSPDSRIADIITAHLGSPAG